MQTLNRDSLLKLYDRLTGLIGKLPGGLQKPILRELLPIRELFLEQRPPRLLIVGGAERVTVPALLGALCGSEVETGEAVNGWRTYRVAERGAVEVLDARLDAPGEFVRHALSGARPDATIFLREDSEQGQPFQAAFESAAERTRLGDPDEGPRPGMVAVAYAGGADCEAARGRLSALLHSHKEFVQRRLDVLASVETAVIAEALCETLPSAAKLEFARMTGAKKAQAEIAQTLLTSFTAVCGVIGLQPIPLADMPVLTTIQSLMVGLVNYVSGRRASARLVAEFVGALGINVGVGFAFREGARALLKVFPIWGNAISGIVAGAGTYAIGRCAIAYFIEDTPIQETRKLFRKLRPGLGAFRPYSARKLVPPAGQKADQ
jgi:uncharacterized protein (DUF697 family)